MVQRVQAAVARKKFASLFDRSARGERIKVTRYGQTLAAIIPKRDLKKLEDCEEAAAPAKRQARRKRARRKP